MIWQCGSCWALIIGSHCHIEWKTKLNVAELCNVSKLGIMPFLRESTISLHTLARESCKRELRNLSKIFLGHFEINICITHAGYTQCTYTVSPHISRAHEKQPSCMFSAKSFEIKYPFVLGCRLLSFYCKNRE